MPSSSSHALFGGLIGATWVAAGASAIQVRLGGEQVLLPLVLSPIVAGIVALAATYFAYRIATRGEEGTITKGFRLSQIVSASMVALAHGTNDAQKTMGVITLTLITVGLLPADAGPPLWVIATCGLAIALGTSLGGWRIIQTMGKRISGDPEPTGVRGRDQQRGGHSDLGAPGLRAVHHPGLHRRDLRGRRRAQAGRRAVGRGRRMALAWLLTLPSAAIVGALAAWVASAGTLGTIVVAVVRPVCHRRRDLHPVQAPAGQRLRTSTTCPKPRRSRSASEPEDDSALCIGARSGSSSWSPSAPPSRWWYW